MKFLVPCLGISLFLCTFVQAQVAPNTNLILNGSFEESHGLDGITSASRLVPSVPGWTKGGANDFEIQFKKTGGYYPSQGDVKVVLNNIQNSSIVQTVQVETGKRYLLTFDYSSGTTNIDASSLDVKINGEIISGLSSPNPSWKKQEVQFKAEASSIELSFEATGSGDSTGALVDNIRLYPIVNDFYTDNLVVNGSFEDSHNILNNNFKFFTSLGAWKTIASNSLPIPFKVLGKNKGYIKAFDKKNLIELDGIQNSSIQQSVSTIPGRLYELKAYYTPRDASFGSSNDVLVFIDGVMKGTLSDPIVKWKLYSFPFTAVTSATKIEFRASGRSDGKGGLLDLVTVRESTKSIDLIVNGSFEESPVFPKQEWGVFTSINGWTTNSFTSSEVPFEIQSGNEINYQARDGISKLELDSYTNTKVYQNIAAIESRQYLLEFSYSPSTDNNSETNGAQIKWNDQVIFDLASAKTGWTDYSKVVQGIAGTSKLEFIGTGSGDSFGAFIDAISVREIGPANPPLADFTVTKVGEFPNVQLVIDASLSNDDSGQLTYTWRFTGPTLVESTNPITTLDITEPGYYDVTLVVKDSTGNSTYYYKKLYVGEGPEVVEVTSSYDILRTSSTTSLPPISIAQLSSDEVKAGEAVTFDASSSFSFSSTIVSYRFVFGDGTEIISSTPTVTHIYETEGNMQPFVIVTDANGLNSTAMFPPLYVFAPIPTEALLNLSNVQGRAPFTITLDASSSLPIGKISEYNFDFGDGTNLISPMSVVQHTYLVAGNYTIKLNIKETPPFIGTDDTEMNIIVLPKDDMPIAMVNTSSLQGRMPLEVLFDAGPSKDDFGITNYKWDFKDGSPVQSGPFLKVISHTFTSSGSYPVVLTITDTAGQEAQKVVTVNVSPSATHLADFIIYNDNGKFPASVTFDATTVDTKNEIFVFKWVVNGQTTTKNTPVLNHTFTEAGSYTVSLTTTNSSGIENTKTKIITLTNSIDTADYTYSTASTIAGSTYQFDGSLSENMVGIEKFSWDFGEGSVLDLTSPIVNHMFTVPGNYQVKLKTTHTDGHVSETLKNIIVSPNNAPVARLKLSNLSGIKDSTFNISSLGSLDDEAIVLYELDLGDGSPVQTSINNINTSYSYSSEGEYTIRLTVRDRQGKTGTYEVLYSTNNPSSIPVADFVADKQEGNVPLAVKFDASMSSDDEGISKYHWSISNGEKFTKTTPVFNYTFGLSGSYQVGLVVEDQDGFTSQKITTIRVNRAPLAAFVASADNSVFPARITLDASQSNDDSDGLTYSWMLDDGTVLIPATPDPVSEVFLSDKGEFVIQLKVTDKNGLYSIVTNEVRVNLPPVARAIISPMIGDYPLNISLNALVSTDDTGIATYQWAYVDGDIISDSAIASITLSDPGFYAVRLTITDDEGASSIIDYPLNVLSNPPPVSTFAYKLSSTIVPAVVEFDANLSEDNRKIDFYRWQFGEASFVQTTSPKTSFTYHQAGTYPVTLTVVDDQGLTSASTQSITVKYNSAPVSSLLASSSTGEIPLAIVFDGSASRDEESKITYSWNFGDGSQITGGRSKESHTYKTPGSYLVTLQVTDDHGLSSISQTQIDVINPSLADTSAPEVFTNLENGPITYNHDEIVFALRDDNIINYETLRLTLNNEMVPSSNVIFDSTNNLVRFILDPAVPLVVGQTITLGLRIADEIGNFTSKAYYYNVVNQVTPDLSGPIVNFLPAGGDLSSLTPNITVAAYDKSGVDFQSFEATLNGIKIPETLITFDIANSRALIQLTSEFALIANSINVIQTKLKDNLGNLSFAGVGFDTRSTKTTIVNLPGQSPIGVSSLGASPYFNCSITTNGLKCWGFGGAGVLGLGIPDSPNLLPKDSGFVSIGGIAKEISVAPLHSCVLLTDGNVRCWGGWNDYGEMGLANTQMIGDDEVPSSKPVIDLGGEVKLIATGFGHNCAVKTDNNVICWGRASDGALGLGQGTSNNIGNNEHPSSVGNVVTGNTSPIIKIIAGQFHTCILNSEGKVKCWGRNNNRILGFGTDGDIIGDNETAEASPFLDFGEPVVDISGGSRHICAILQSRNLKCWGSNSHGQLGTANTTTPTSSMLLLPNVNIGEGVKTVSVMENTTCVITESDKARCWGDNQYGQLGLGHFNNIGDNEFPSSVNPIELGEPVLMLNGSGQHTCAKVLSGKFYCWGFNLYKQIGIDETIADRNPNPLEFGPVDLDGSGTQQPALVAKISADKYFGTLPLQVTFDGTQSSSNPGTITEYTWNFGDGTTVTETSGTVSHTYTSSGVSIASLTVKNSDGFEATVTASISVNTETINPVAHFTSDAEFHKIGDSFIFNGATSYDPTGSVESYYWNFGDGTLLTTTNPQAGHAYQNLGLYLVSLTVSGTGGRASSTYSYPVFVNALNEAPVAQFNCIPGDYTVSCTALTSVDFDGAIKVYEWDMGDGEILLGQNINYSYAKPGIGKYKVTLKVTDNGGLSHSKETPIYKFDFVAPIVETSIIDNVNLTDAKLRFTLNVLDDNITQTEILVNNELVLVTDEKSLASYLSLANGTNRIEIKVSDLAGNISQSLIFTNINAINTVPQIAIANTSPVYTKISAYPLVFQITDDGPTKTSVIRNNEVLHDELADKEFNGTIELQEGQNRIEIVTFDDSKQTSSKVIENIILDTIAPRLISINPKNGSRFIGVKDFTINGRASEELSSVTIDNELVTLESDRSKFSLQKTVEVEGDYSYSVTLTDRAGNQTSINNSYTMLLHILYPDLVTIISDNDRLKIVGKPGATRFPGQKVAISGGWFNSAEAISEADGSFEAYISKAETVDISSYHPELNFSESHRLFYLNDTTLSGVIKDVAGMPLPGVKVTIVSANKSAISDESGVFSIPNSSSGDQKIEIDATLVPESITLGQKKYSKTYLNITMGYLERNVLERPIFLTPIYIDGSETIVEPSQGAMVTSSHAPGVMLEIPANAVSFPTGTAIDVNGEMKNVINIAKIDSNNVSVAVPEAAVPDSVYALEPSGVTFSQPVKLTLPNDNELAEGTPVVILSKNSSTGAWEVDGAGEVNGGMIETLPGQGITHFSEVYAVPYGLEIKARENGELPTIDSQSGALTTSIGMPSFKVMGQDVNPALIYKSSWANPNVIVSNVFNLKRDYSIQRVSDSTNIFGIAGGSGEVTQEVWTAPEEIKSKFFIDDIEGQEIVIDATNAPEQAVVSYAFDLSDLASGQYFARSNYEIKYKHLVVTTTKIKTNTFGDTSTDIERETREIFDTLFPEPLGQIIHVQNKKDSPYGRGWKLGLNQEVLNPGSSRLLVEESSGAASSYLLDNSIETLVYDKDGIQAASLDSAETVTFVKANGKVASVQIAEGSDPLEIDHDELYDIPSFEIDQRMNIGWKSGRSGRKCSGAQVGGECGGHWYYDFSVGCEDNVYNVRAPKKISSFLNWQNTSYYLDPRGALFKYQGQESLIAGKVGLPGKITTPGSATYPNTEEICTSKFEAGCNIGNRRFHQAWNRSTVQRNPNFVPSFNYCGPIPAYTQPTSMFGNFPFKGYQSGTLTESMFNDPQDVTPSKTDGDAFYVADSGNHIVRKVILSQNKVIDFAGNRQANGEDEGDNVPALEAKIIRPQGVVADSLGNVYISSQKGLIRKVSKEGMITILAGKLANGGAPSDTSSFERLNLKSPSGMVIDESKNLLYVADTGNNRIVALDLGKSTAYTVAGNYNCNFGPEHVRNGNPALDVSICLPEKIGLDENKNLLILDKSNKMIRRVLLKFTAGGKAIYASASKDGSKIERADDGSFTRIYRDGSKAKFDKLGRHLSTADRLNNITQYQYELDGRLVSIIDPKGGQSSVTYSGGLISSFTDPASRTSSFNHDAGELLSVQFPDSTQKFFEYQGPDGQMSKEYNQRSNATRYQYNQWKRLTKVIRPDGTSVSSSETITDTIANGSTSANPKEAKSYGENNGEGNELEEIYANAKGVVTVLNKDFKGYVSSITDANNLVTKFERDNEGRPIRIDRPDNTFTTIKYNEFGDVIESFESTSQTKKEFHYNSEGNLILASLTIAGNTKSNSLQYFANGLISSEIDFNQNKTSRQYFNDGLISSTLNNSGEALFLKYDIKGNLNRTIADMGEETITERDFAGNVLKLINAKGVATKYTYDLFNRLTKVEKGITVNKPNGEIVNYEYNEVGSLIAITDSLGNVTSFEYNSMERLIRKTSPLGQISQITYDSNGNVLTEVDPNGNLKTYEYNLADQVVKKFVPDNAYVMTYSETGNLMSVSDNDSLLEFNYEKVNGKDTITSAKSSGELLPEMNLNFQYNDFGNRTSLITPFGNFTYSFDPGNRLTSIVNHLEQSFSLNYDESNRLKLITRPGSRSEFSFDRNGFLTNLDHKRSDQIINQMTFERDAIGNNIKTSSSRGIASFSFDAENQLKSVSNTEAGTNYQNENFNYDAIGNRKNDQLGEYLYDEKNTFLKEDYKFFYNYDNNGNLTSRARKGISGTVTNYVYSSENQLSEVHEIANFENVKFISYFYDSLGRRVRKVVVNLLDSTKSFERRYTYNGNERLAEYNDENTVLAVYTHSTLGTDNTLATNITVSGQQAGLALESGSYFYLKDSLGSITDIVNEDGVLIQHYVYSSFGKILKITDNLEQDVFSDPPVKSDFTFTNREHDEETGFYYYRARYYDPSIGRFLQIDPHPGFLDVAITVENKYTYAGNNPINYKDPSGKVFGIDDFLIMIAVSAVINAVVVSAVSDGDFFTNLFSAQVGGKALVQGAMTALFTGGLGWAGSLVGPGTATALGALGGVLNTYAQSKIFKTNPSFGNYLIAGSLGALIGLGVAAVQSGVLKDTVSNLGKTISDFSRDVFGYTIDTQVPQESSIVKPAM